MCEPSTTHALRVLTVNIHKGYDLFNRRYVLHELRDAVHAVGCDLVFLQEVEGGSGSARAAAVGAQVEFLADEIWPLLRMDRTHVRGVVAYHPLPLPGRPWSRLSDDRPLAAEIVLREEP